MELTLSGAESRVLRESVEQALDTLLMEIARADNRKFRVLLKEREEILERILAKLSAGEMAA
jgi:hypothetical protein